MQALVMGQAPDGSAIPVKVAADGTVAVSGGAGGGGGDASAANQLTEIARLEAVRDRLPVSLGTKTAAASLPVTLSSDGPFAANFGATTDAAAGSDTGAASFMALVKRLLSVKLADLIAGRAPVDTLGQPAVARQLAVTSTTTNQALTSTCRRISIRARGCPMRYAVGVGAQTADGTTSHFIDQDERLDLAVPSGANIAAIAVAPWGASTVGTGSLAITELA